MFFTPELLERRDSGFGLLWLAATLGAKSTLKKLPRRSVLSADISQLCELIAQPVEPLALRLTSNLMIGVARVYKVKQEIFLSDVTICSNSLKKVFQEMRSTDEQLQMAQPSVKAGTLTLVSDPRKTYAMDFDNLVADWDEFLNIEERANGEEDDEDEDGEFNPKYKKAKRKAKPTSLSLMENPRADLYLLNENPDHLLSASFDASFQVSGGAAWDPSSSQLNVGFGFDDDIFAPDDSGLGIGDELARELGEGWGATPFEHPDIAPMNVDVPVDFQFGSGMDIDFNFGGDAPLVDGMVARMSSEPGNAQLTRKRAADQGEEVVAHVPIINAEAVPISPNTSSAQLSFAEMLLAQDNAPHSERGSPTKPQEKQRPIRPYKKPRLLFDARTELTDEELQSARAGYVEDQRVLRRELELKRAEKEGSKLMENLMFCVPTGLQAQILIDFWSENFRIRMEARAGPFYTNANGRAQPERRRRANGLEVIEDEQIKADAPDGVPDWNTDPQMEFDFGIGMAAAGGTETVGEQIHAQLRSSEEPGQARHVSRPPSISGDAFGLDRVFMEPHANSQRSLFPWDHAGPSSSVLDAAGEGGDSVRLSIDRPDIKLRGSTQSRSRRGSSFGASHLGSGMGAVGFSPGIALERGGSQLNGEDFVFDVPAENSLLDIQQPDVNVLTLEKHSLNFFEYVKMLNQSLPNSVPLTLENIVPKPTSTRHVAAAAFYHCLVLAAKDLLRLNQAEAYGPVTIAIIS